MTQSLTHQLRAWADVGLHTLAQTVWRQPQGLERAVEHFAAEGWLLLPVELRQKFDSYGRCTACQACNAVCPLLQGASPLVFHGPMDLPLRILRRAPDLLSSKEALAIYQRCGSCRACEDACPEQIPILEMAAALSAVVATAEPLEQPPDTASKSKPANAQDPG